MELKLQSKTYALTQDEVWEQQKSIQELVLKIKEDKDLESYKDITIGLWGEAYDESVQEVLDFLCDNKERLTNLETLYIGDMDYEDCEISWIMQGDYTRITKELVNLKKLKIKGSTGLKLSPIKSDKLEQLEIICGGLDKDIIHDISESEVPNLKTLVVYIGVNDYGFDGDIDDIKLLLHKEKFPSLVNLELVDSEIQDDIVEAVIGSDILPQLETISFSYGTMTNKGGQMIIDNKEKFMHLKNIQIKWHYMDDDMQEKLKETGFKVNLEDAQDVDYYEGEMYLIPMVTE